MKHHLFFLQAISSVHYGAGQGAGDIDLPVAKDGVTGHPKIPGSGIKGVLRDNFENGMKIANEETAKDMTTALFGPSTDKAAEHASAISVGDGRMLALPVRSYFGTFAFLTSPMVLSKFKAELQRCGLSVDSLHLPEFVAKAQHYHAQITSNSCLTGGGIEGRILLEEVDLLIDDDQSCADAWAEAIAEFTGFDDDEKTVFCSRLVIADDNVLNFLCETALPVEPHIAIDNETGTVKNGALWFEENVPAESLFYGRLSVDKSYSENHYDAEQLAEFLIKDRPPVLQVGGKATTGKGFVKMMFAKDAEG